MEHPPLNALVQKRTSSIYSFKHFTQKEVHRFSSFWREFSEDIDVFLFEATLIKKAAGIPESFCLFARLQVDTVHSV